MLKFINILASLGVLTASVISQQALTKNECHPRGNDNVVTCIRNDRLLHVRSTVERKARINVADFSTVSQYAIRRLKLESLELGLLQTEDCTPKLVNLTAATFKQQPELTSLMLKCIHLPAEENNFEYLSKLTSLSLTRVNFAELSQHFAILAKLKFLKLNDVGITSITPATFSTITEQLTQLTIKDQVENIDNKSFTKFRALDGLALSKINLTILPDGVFDGLANLRNLVLANNEIEKFNASTFKALPKLQQLYMQSNKIRYIENGTFHDLNIYVLNLTHNKLTEISKDTFLNLQNLTKLDLSFNEISVFQPGAISNCPKLRVVKLDNNQLKRTSAYSFAGLRLTSLTLHDNKITMIDADSFNNLIVLSLDARRNKIRGMAPNSFRQFTAKNVWFCYDGTERDIYEVGKSHNSSSITNFQLIDCDT